ncbi:MAG: IS1 family transposase [Longimicrobiaceae bacterium]|nr:hypothetical protein [Gemmatimonadota bacterium]
MTTYTLFCPSCGGDQVIRHGKAANESRATRT